MPSSDILGFADALFKNRIRVNEINLSKGKQNSFNRFSEGFELSGLNYYKKIVEFKGN